MQNLTFDRAPEDPCLLRVQSQGVDLHWRWRLSRNPIAVDWLFEQLVAGRLDNDRNGADRTHGWITELVREHWVPGDENYEEPRQVEELVSDRRFDHLERGGPEGIAQVLAKTRWRYEREMRWLRQEIKVLRRQLSKKEVGGHAGSLL